LAANYCELYRNYIICICI